MRDSVTFRFRETSKYSHRYGQTCSTYVIATAHACGLVEGTLARDHGELVARSRNTRGVRYIVSKEIVIKTCYKTVQLYFLLRPSSCELASRWISKTAFPSDFHSGERIEKRGESSFLVKFPNCQIFLSTMRKRRRSTIFFLKAYFLDILFYLSIQRRMCQVSQNDRND